MPDTEIFIVSACLAGCATRYDGKDNACDAVVELVRQGRAIPVCPEQLGGLPTPRPCSERREGRVVTDGGEDVTDAFTRGAHEALRLARLAGCRTAVLKMRSPSCGAGRIYDGTFSGTLIPGDGVFAALCKAEGITVLSEETFTAEDAACPE